LRLEFNNTRGGCLKARMLLKNRKAGYGVAKIIFVIVQVSRKRINVQPMLENSLGRHRPRSQTRLTVTLRHGRRVSVSS
jgi:hypothetical protein